MKHAEWISGMGRKRGGEMRFYDKGWVGFFEYLMVYGYGFRAYGMAFSVRGVDAVGSSAVGLNLYFV